MKASTAELLQSAVARLSGGNLVVADFFCRDILAVDPQNADALNILGIVAAKIGLRSEAIDFFKSALFIEPDFGPAENNLRKLANRAAPDVPHAIDGRRYLLIKAWGFGFWSDVSHVLGALLLADITGRIPVTHWGKNSLFGDGSDRDAFRNYFEPVSPLTLDSLLEVRGADFFPAKWSAANLRLEEQTKWSGPDSRIGAIQYLARPETVAVADFYIGAIDLIPWIPKSHRLFGKTIDEVYRDLAERYLQPRLEIAAAVETFYREHLSGAPSIADHLRGSDKRLEMNELDSINQSYFGILDRFDPLSRIFLLTDDARWINAFRTRYGDRVVTTDCRRTDGDKGVHYLPSEDRTRLGTEVMVDTYLAMHCARFVGNGSSNVSAIAAALKPWRDGECTLVAPSLLHSRNSYIYSK